jgi:hypothetical protein
VAAPALVLPWIRHGIEFVSLGESGGELRVTGGDDASLLLWGAQGLDEHRDWIIADSLVPAPRAAGR